MKFYYHIGYEFGKHEIKEYQESILETFVEEHDLFGGLLWHPTFEQLDSEFMIKNEEVLEKYLQVTLSKYHQRWLNGWVKNYLSHKKYLTPSSTSHIARCQKCLLHDHKILLTNCDAEIMGKVLE